MLQIHKWWRWHLRSHLRQHFKYTNEKNAFFTCANRLALQSCWVTDEHLHVCEYHQCISYCPVEVFFPWGGARVILPHLAGGCTDIKICLTWWRLQKWLSVHVVTPESHQLIQSDCCHLTAVCNFEIFCIVSPACTVFSYPPALCRLQKPVCLLPCFTFLQCGDVSSSRNTDMSSSYTNPICP